MSAMSDMLWVLLWIAIGYIAGRLMSIGEKPKPRDAKGRFVKRT